MWEKTIIATARIFNNFFKFRGKCPNCRTRLRYKVIMTGEIDLGNGCSHLNTIVGYCDDCGFEKVIHKERVETELPVTDCCFSDY